MTQKKTGTTSTSTITKGASTLRNIIHFLQGENFQFIIGLLSLIFAVFLLVSFTSFFFTGASDQSIVTDPEPGELLSTDNHIQNSTGARGAVLAEFFINRCFGLAAYFIVLFLIVAGLRLMKAYRFRLWKWFLSCVLLMIWTSIFLGFLFENNILNSFIYPGGLHGYNVSRWLCSQIGHIGVALLLLGVALIYLVYMSNATIRIIRRCIHPSFKSTKSQPSPVEKKAEQEPAVTHPEETVTEDSEKDDTPADNPESTLTFELDTKPSSTNQSTTESTTTVKESASTAHDEEKKSSFLNKETTVPSQKEPEFNINIPADEEETAYVKQLPPYNPRLDLENYHAPTVDLLKKYEDNAPSIDRNELEANKDRIIEVLRSFGVEISSINATVGPTVTLYEITPAQGVRIAKIRNLGSDIALSLAAKGIRIIAPIPGKGTIGIEVPNSKPRIVPMRDIIADKKFQESTLELPIALGKTITNNVYIADLCKMPHILVAGATGQGKSVGLNAIITSLLYKKHPAELKFVMVDPKMVEFSMYNPIEKHFLAKLPDGEEAIITDPTKVVQTLQSLCVEMDNRYELLKAANVRQIKEYNQKFINRQLNPEKGHKFLPYIVVIIDEFGDLIMTAGKEIETPIARIAQKARAVGIHMIIATQRPAANIITGVIRANFPARIAFKVSTMMESRIILDTPGAEQLIGRGDMLISQGNELTRIQCAFVDTPEVESIAEYISHQQGYPSAFYLPEYVGDESEGSVNEVDMNRLDPLFADAARLIVSYQQGSTSLIQRKFSIGYNRAGRIMDQLEHAGIVGPSEGSKARQVMCISLDDLETRLSNLNNTI